MSSSTDSELRTLTGLEGAKRVVRRLTTASDSTHAVLFYGPEGSGKEELGRILAKYWLCKTPSSDGGADGSCSACTTFARSTNPDFLAIRPTGLSSQIVIDQIQEGEKNSEHHSLAAFFRSGPIMSSHKVAVISDAYRMNGPASNSLLKTLEEPPPFGKIVLTTDSVVGVRQTILSRCLAVACALPTGAEIAEAFPEATSEDRILCQDSPGKLTRLLQAPDPYRRLIRFAKELPGKKAAETLVVSESFRVLCEAIEAVRQVGARASNAEALGLLATALSRRPEVPPWWVQAIIEAQRRVIGNAQPGILIDALFAQLLTSD